MDDFDRFVGLIGLGGLHGMASSVRLGCKSDPELAKGSGMKASVSAFLVVLWNGYGHAEKKTGVEAICEVLYVVVVAWKRETKGRGMVQATRQDRGSERGW